MNKRYLGALILAPLLIFLLIGGLALKLVILILSLMGLYEFYKTVENKNIHPFKILSYIFCCVYYLSIIFNNSPVSLIYIIPSMTIICFCISVINIKYNFVDAGTTVLGFLYVPVLFSFIILINDMNFGKYLVWLIFISSWVGDTLAYYTGKKFGKKKLCPEVSPKKTVAGSIGGLLGSMIGCIIFGMIIRNFGVKINLIHYIFIGLCGGILGQFGDLAASTIKRTAGVKDYSNIIPGHGGILDRFDSILFTSFLVYYYITLILGM